MAKGLRNKGEGRERGGEMGGRVKGEEEEREGE